uniref:Tyrosinase copper-binding domain-containing protein n=1 Tax=Rhizochromulina marina TaxID=1034831 RepID=A0A7S2SA39_9STRA
MPAVEYQRPMRVTAFFGALAVFLLGAAVYRSSVQQPTVGVSTVTLATAEEATTDNSTSRSLICKTSYEEKNGRTLGYLYGFGSVAQAYRETYLTLNTGEAVYWTVDDVEVTTDEPLKEISVLFKDLDKHTVAINHGEEVFTVHSKVVRREIRDLDQADLDAYLDAAYEIYTVGQEAGVSKYGENFESIYKLLQIHLYGAADKACDHWHDDAGMVNHHVGITWKFEQSLRMIDPTTASHYWDYTREVANGVAWWETSIFQDDYFGSNSPDNEDHIVTEGRWGYLPIMANAREFSTIVNPYGLLRSPWNTNPVPYLMRSNETVGIYADGYQNFATCKDFAEAIDDHSFSDLMNALNGELHGPVHIMIGGHWGMSELYKKIFLKLKGGADAFLLMAKYLWRQGVIRVPEYCAKDTPGEHCKSTCPESIVGAKKGLDVEEIFHRYGLYNVSDNIGTMVRLGHLMGATDWEILQELCSFGYPGEMFTSSAPQDPTFWPLHGNVERVLQLLRVKKHAKKYEFDETWGYEHKSYTPSDTHHVCDWTGVEGMEMPTCYSGTCPGHRADDLLPFGGLMEDQDGFYTNQEFYDLISPGNSEMPYVYDSIDFWPGCTDASLWKEYEIYATKTKSETFNSGSSYGKPAAEGNEGKSWMDGRPPALP